MKLIKKIRNKGIKESFKVAVKKFNGYVNAGFFCFFKAFPLKSYQIIMESEGDFCDNSFALYDYMKQQGYLKKYKIIWLVSEPKNFVDSSDTIFVNKQWEMIHIKTAYYLATSKFYIYDHNCIFKNCYKRKEQEIIYLAHGTGYKAQKKELLVKPKTFFDITFATGNIPANIHSFFWKCDMKCIKVLGYPRNDYFFSDLTKVKEILNEEFHFFDFKTVILWMPTFRKSTAWFLSEEYSWNETELPIFKYQYQLVKFNNFLSKENILLVLKVHHLQAELPVFKEKYSNLLIIKDEMINKLHIQLYEFIGTTDALITDYSSISVDYMLLNRPIIYTLDDYKEYSTSRGIYPPNAIELMKGYHVYNIDELILSIKEIADGKDRYGEERKKIITEFHSNLDGNSSKRIIDYIGLKRD